MLSGQQIVEEGIVAPREPAAIQPASVDLTLSDDWFYRLRPGRVNIARDRPEYEWQPSLVLEPGEFALAATEEWVDIPPEFVGRVEGKSTLARMGLIVHTTAGFIDPGFHGKITLELCNVGPCSLVLEPGMYICQLSVARMERVDGVYKWKYQGARGVEGAKLA